VPIRPKGGLDVFMTQPLTHQDNGSAQVDEEGGMGVAQIVEPDLLHPGRLAALRHLLVEVALREGEEPVVRVGLIEGIHVGLDLKA